MGDVGKMRIKAVAHQTNLGTLSGIIMPTDSSSLKILRRRSIKADWRATAKSCQYRTRDASRLRIGNPLCSALDPHIMRCTFSKCPYQIQKRMNYQEEK